MFSTSLCPWPETAIWRKLARAAKWSSTWTRENALRVLFARYFIPVAYFSGYLSGKLFCYFTIRSDNLFCSFTQNFFSHFSTMQTPFLLTFPEAQAESVDLQMFIRTVEQIFKTRMTCSWISFLTNEYDSKISKVPWSLMYRPDTAHFQIPLTQSRVNGLEDAPILFPSCQYYAERT